MTHKDEESAVRLSMEDHIATIVLNRPERLNALDIPTTRLLHLRLRECAEDEAVRVLILTGTDRAFCAGGDMRAVWNHVQAGGQAWRYLRDLTAPLHQVAADLRRMPKPVIAAVNGPAAGAGLSLAAACDLRLAARGSTFKQAYTSIGLVPDAGWTCFVARVLGPARASRLLLLDEPFDAQLALELGLLHEVVEPSQLLARAAEMAREMMRQAPTSLARAKQMMNASLFPDLDTILRRERKALIAQSRSWDFREGLQAFVDKRQPVFPGH